MSTESREAETSTTTRTGDRVFLVVVDDSAEMARALRFACRRARKTGGRVALLRVIEPADFQHWQAVGELMQEEAREGAEALVQQLAPQVAELTGAMPVIYIRDGSLREEVLKLVDEEPSISIMVLAAAGDSEDPGPLITDLARKSLGKLRIPVTIVPGGLSDAEIDAIT